MEGIIVIDCGIEDETLVMDSLSTCCKGGPNQMK